MLPKIAAKLELNGIEKLYCLDWNWLTICHAAHLIGDQNVIINNIQYVIPLLLKRHPRLRARIHIENNKRSLEIFDYDPQHFDAKLFYTIIDTGNHSSWEEIVENECNRNPYTNNGEIIFPLFYILFIPNENTFHLLLFTNHCVFDGRSGYVLINDVLSLVTSPNLHDKEEFINREVIPCITDIVPRPYGIMYPLIRTIGKYIYKKEMGTLNNTRFPFKTVRLSEEQLPCRFQPAKIKFLFSSSSLNLCQRLHEKCQAQKVTLHGPLMACILLAIDNFFPLTNSERMYLNPINIDVDFNMRSRLPQSPLTQETIGLFVSIGRAKLSERFPLHSTLFWTLATKCMNATQSLISTGEINIFLHLLRDIIENEETFHRFIQSSRDGCLSEVNFSNIGKYPYPCEYNQGQLQLKGLHVVNNASIYRTGLIIFVTCASGSQFDISIAHELENEDTAKQFLKYYVNLLEKCAETGPQTTLNQLISVAEF